MIILFLCCRNTDLNNWNSTQLIKKFSISKKKVRNVTSNIISKQINITYYLDKLENKKQEKKRKKQLIMKQKQIINSTFVGIEKVIIERNRILWIWKRKHEFPIDFFSNTFSWCIIIPFRFTYTLVTINTNSEYLTLFLIKYKSTILQFHYFFTLICKLDYFKFPLLGVSFYMNMNFIIIKVSWLASNTNFKW